MMIIERFSDDRGNAIAVNAMNLRTSSPLTPAGLIDLADFSLGEALVRPSQRRIEGPAQTIRIEPRVMQVLVALYNAKGAVVSRDALIEQCWGGVFVSDDSLNRAIGQVRQALRRAGVEGETVETIPRAGYHLTVGGPWPAQATGTEASARNVGRRSMIAGAFGIAALGVAGLGIWHARRDPADERVVALLGQSEGALRQGTPAGNMQATRLLERVITAQPDNALGWGKLALARTYLAEVTPPDQVAAIVAGVQEAARRAFALDPDQIDAHAALAILPPYFGDWRTAELRMLKVLERDPDHLPMLDTHIFFKVATGSAREGSAQRLIVAEREPFHAVHQFKKVYSFWILGRNDEADRAVDRALRLWPRHPAIWFARLWTLVFTGRAGRARAHVEDAEARPDFPPWLIETISASMEALTSRRPADIADATLRTLAVLDRGPAQSVFAILQLVALGEIDRAFDVARAYLLERGPLIATLRWRPGQFVLNDLQQRSTHMLFLPATAAMRADPRFMRLCGDMGLLDYWEQADVRPDFLGAEPPSAS